ncbi:Pentatricopeptide repeat-containing protein [Carex littledalei]|uniref:Pentatricopeptide repeat-containing protein n=1 Tax=Carex littledalei TaxID=544730 RepID=A0A833VEZ3_9POAL|nr:Pentatricopeptide repeat-containing protein [Carex littledalei]
MSVESLKAPSFGVEPNCVTYSTGIGGCMKLGDLKGGFKLFHEMLKRGVSPDVVCYNLLIDGLFKKCIGIMLKPGKMYYKNYDCTEITTL